MRAAHIQITAIMLTPVLLRAAPDPETGAAALAAETIVALAVRNATTTEVLASYTVTHTKRTFDLDRNGSVEGASVDRYRVYTRCGEPFYELVERDGQPASAADLRKEGERRRRFREHMGSDEDAAQPSRAFQLDAAMAARYDFSLLRRESIAGRTTWVLAFQPKSGHLPVTRQIDEALNRSKGLMWIDAEDYGLARIEFSLAEPVRIWSGLLGSLTQFEGHFEQERLAPGHWLPRLMRLEMDGWAPFRSLRKRVHLDWRDYQRGGAQTEP